MLKYLDTKVTFSEVPDEITLCISISGCKIHCKGCHSPELSKDEGTPLTEKALDELIEANKGITCVALLGGDSHPIRVYNLCAYIRHKGLKSCWYSGKSKLPKQLDYEAFDFVKFGPYKEALGPLSSPTTNQVFLQVERWEGKITSLFDRTKEFRKK